MCYDAKHNLTFTERIKVINANESYYTVVKYGNAPGDHIAQGLWS